jgi:hypothetical protein
MTAPDVARRLPDIPTLRARCRALAAAEAMVNPSGEYANHVYAANWGESEEALFLDTGSGDDCTVVLAPAGVYIRAFSHESPMSPYGNDEMQAWPGVLDSVPEVFRAYVDDPAFTDDGLPRVTACIWRETGDTHWHTGDIAFPDDEEDDVDGADWLLDLLIEGTPEAFREWAEDYYERPVDLEAVRRVYAEAGVPDVAGQVEK